MVHIKFYWVYKILCLRKIVTGQTRLGFRIVECDYVCVRPILDKYIKNFVVHFRNFNLIQYTVRMSHMWWRQYKNISYVIETNLCLWHLHLRAVCFQKCETSLKNILNVSYALWFYLTIFTESHNVLQHEQFIPYFWEICAVLTVWIQLQTGMLKTKYFLANLVDDVWCSSRSNYMIVRHNFHPVIPCFFPCMRNPAVHLSSVTLILVHTFLGCFTDKYTQQDVHGGFVSKPISGCLNAMNNEVLHPISNHRHLETKGTNMELISILSASRKCARTYDW